MMSDDHGDPPSAARVPAGSVNRIRRAEKANVGRGHHVERKLSEAQRDTCRETRRFSYRPIPAIRYSDRLFSYSNSATNPPILSALYEYRACDPPSWPRRARSA